MSIVKKKKNCRKIGLTVVFLRSWISFPPSHLWVMRRIEGSYLKGWRMDCCCHLDLPTRNLDGPPEPEKVFKTVSNSDLFLLYSQDTLQAAVYTNLWEINYFNISWQSKSQASRKPANNMAFHDNWAFEAHLRSTFEMTVVPSQENKGAELVWAAMAKSQTILLRM